MAKGILIKNGSGISLPTLTNEATSDELLVGKELINSEGKILVGTGDLIGLNFDVVGGISQPANPKENTIWVNTTDTITGWAFSANEPSNPVNGMVWFVCSGSSPIDFNALKSNLLEVRPKAAKQYVGGIWVDLTANIYQNGEWVSWWAGELFYRGNTFNWITGGWHSWAWRNQSLGNATFTVDGIMVHPSGESCVAATTVNKIDLTNYSTISFKVISNQFKTDGRTYFGVKTDKTVADEALDARIDVGLLSDGTTHSLDISGLSGEFYVGLFTWNGTEATYFKYTIDEVKLG